MEGVVDVGDDDLRAVAQPRRRLEQEALEDDHVGPVGELAQSRTAGREDLEVGMRDLRSAGGGQADLVLGGERLGDLPRTDRGTGHAVQQRLAGHDEDPVPGGEVLDDAERLDQHLVRREVGGMPYAGSIASRNSGNSSRSLRRRRPWSSRRDFSRLGSWSTK